MSNLPTPHNQAEKGQIAQTVLMPGDPLRAKFIAENYLTEVSCFNQVRNMLGYTGVYQGTKISVMGSGMGMPSMGIYSYELYHFYGVETIVRIGTAGAVSDKVSLRDLVIAAGACTDSNYAAQYGLPGTFAPIGTYEWIEKAAAIAREKNFKAWVGNVVSSDHFYLEQEDSLNIWKKMGILAVEMETAALYMNAAREGKNALGIFTISDCPLRGESLPAAERQVGFRQMMELALQLAV